MKKLFGHEEIKLIDMYDFLCLEKFLTKEHAEINDFILPVYQTQFNLYIPTFQVKDTIGDGMSILIRNKFRDKPVEFRY